MTQIAIYIYLVIDPDRALVAQSPGGVGVAWRGSRLGVGVRVRVGFRLGLGLGMGLGRAALGSLTVRAIGLAQSPHRGAHDEARPRLRLGKTCLHHAVDDLLAHAEARTARPRAQEGEVCEGLPRLGRVRGRVRVCPAWVGLGVSAPPVAYL